MTDCYQQEDGSSVEDVDNIKCYKGFDRSWHPQPVYVAIVLIDGEVELWALDDPDNAPCELRRYYEEGGLPAQEIRIYRIEKTDFVVV